MNKHWPTVVGGGLNEMASVRVRLNPRPQGISLSSPLAGLFGIELQSPLLGAAAAQGLMRAAARPDSIQFMRDAGLSAEAVEWMSTAPEKALLELTRDVRVVLPSNYLNARAALALSDAARGTGKDTALVPALGDGQRTDGAGEVMHGSLLNYLVSAGAHSQMMLHLCNQTAAQYRTRRAALGLHPKPGRPKSINDPTTVIRVLDEWAKILRTEKGAADFAQRHGESFIYMSLAEQYVHLHMVFNDKDISALYAVVESRPYER